MTNFRNLLRISRPLLLLDAALVYVLGVGIARYLGATVDADIFALGLAWILSLQLGAHYLYAYFRQTNLANSPFAQRAMDLEHEKGRQRWVDRDLPLWIGFASLTLTTSFTLLLMRSGQVSGGSYLVMALITLGAIASALPPLRLAETVYRGLVPSILLANFVPALAFMLQEAELHRLVSMSTFPLILLHYAMLLVFEFQAYAQDMKQERPMLLVVLGWQRGMRLVNLLILSTFLLFGISMLVGLPNNVAWPTFLGLPLGLFLIWYLTRIAEGAKPHWRALNLSAILTYSLTVYLLSLSFWTH